MCSGAGRCGVLRYRCRGTGWSACRADDIDARAVVDRRWWRRVLLDGALDAEIAKADKKMDAVRTILATRRNVTRFDATKEDTEREI